MAETELREVLHEFEYTARKRCPRGPLLQKAMRIGNDLLDAQRLHDGFELLERAWECYDAFDVYARLDQTKYDSEYPCVTRLVHELTVRAADAFDRSGDEIRVRSCLLRACGFDMMDIGATSDDTEERLIAMADRAAEADDSDSSVRYVLPLLAISIYQDSKEGFRDVFYALQTSDMMNSLEFALAWRALAPEYNYLYPSAGETFPFGGEPLESPHAMWEHTMEIYEALYGSDSPEYARALIQWAELDLAALKYHLPRARSILSMYLAEGDPELQLIDRLLAPYEK